MEQYYSRRQDDVEHISGFLENIERLTDEELIQDYKNNLKVGLSGMHLHSLRLLALRIVFIRRFNKTPIKFIDNCIIRIGEGFEI